MDHDAQGRKQAATGVAGERREDLVASGLGNSSGVEAEYQNKGSS